ncbi:hypothetical protein K435DRAFT_877669 [Dendrothele bispora CBS 962.96]|uniref:Uncharacterized protein n=1 Tax=Dendrothele bispora (strain CBS 962.96) TaxID=1314807 RepID=A0A4S8KPK0_DENBC|nr:hypothetical protein K435DRAFT_877669 [Dendrothele bispora CBS 962.96]
MTVNTSITDFPYLEHLKLSAGNLVEDWSPSLPVVYQAPRLRHLEIVPADSLGLTVSLGTNYTSIKFAIAKLGFSFDET